MFATRPSIHRKFDVLADVHVSQHIAFVSACIPPTVQTSPEVWRSLFLPRNLLLHLQELAVRKITTSHIRFKHNDVPRSATRMGESSGASGAGPHLQIMNLPVSSNLKPPVPKGVLLHVPRCCSFWLGSAHGFPTDKIQREKNIKI